MKKVVSCFLCVTLLFLMCFTVSAKGVDKKPDQSKVYTMQAFNPTLLKNKIIEKYGKSCIGKDGNPTIKLDLDKPVEFDFADGSSVSYTLFKETLISPASALSGSIQPMVSNSIYVRARYLAANYGDPWGDTANIYLYANCTWGDRSVTINNTWANTNVDKGSATASANRIIVSATGNNMAVTRCTGVITFTPYNSGSPTGETFTHNYMFEMWVDPAITTSGDLHMGY